jgi:hypothetical protein
MLISFKWGSTCAGHIPFLLAKVCIALTKRHKNFELLLDFYALFVYAAFALNETVIFHAFICRM